MDTRAVTTLFDIHPDNLTNELLDQLSGGAGSLINIINLAHSSRRLYSLFSQTDQYKLIKDFLKQAFDYACFGKFDSLEFLLNACPDILLCRATIQHRGRYKFVDRFIWQIVAMNEEADNKRVRTMFEKYFKRLPNGLEEMKKQFLEVFPNKKIIKYGWSLKRAKEFFNDAYDAMLIDTTLDEHDPINKMHDATKNALQIFHAFVTPKPTDEFTKGLLFDFQLFQYIAKKYKAAFSQLNRNQSEFYGVNFWDYLVLLFPTGYLRPVCQGLFYVVGATKEPLTVNGCKLRTMINPGISNFGLGIGTDADVLPIGADANFVYGRDHIDIWGLRLSNNKSHSTLGLFGSDYVKKICRTKETSLRKLLQNPHMGK